MVETPGLLKTLAGRCTLFALTYLPVSQQSFRTVLATFHIRSGKVLPLLWTRTCTRQSIVLCLHFCTVRSFRELSFVCKGEGAVVLSTLLFHHSILLCCPLSAILLARKSCIDDSKPDRVCMYYYYFLLHSHSPNHRKRGKNKHRTVRRMMDTRTGIVNI